MNKTFFLAPLLFLALFLAGCTNSPQDRRALADALAAQGQLQAQIIPAGIFNLMSWQRITHPGAPANVYIEGDGLAWMSRHMKSPNPTPTNPVALRLAAADTGANVIYLARPCQYTNWREEGACPNLYWTGGRTAPEVIASYTSALTALKSRDDIPAFHLIGYSGGAAVAAVLTAQRNDILSLRTVAGNTDYAAFNALHRLSPLQDSIDPATIAQKIAQVPQRHFIGGKDNVVPAAIFKDWQKESGETSCVRSQIIPAATHETQWAKLWPQLLSEPVACAAP